jgi:hypothetical protein
MSWFYQSLYWGIFPFVFPFNGNVLMITYRKEFKAFLSSLLRVSKKAERFNSFLWGSVVI